MRCVYEKRVGFRDAAHEIDQDGGLRDRQNQIDDGNARRRQFTTGGVGDGIAEADGGGTHIAMPDDEPDDVVSSLSGAGKTHVGSFPPGDYVTVVTSSGFHVYRMDPVRMDLGTTYGTANGGTSDRATSLGTRRGFADAAVARRTTDRIRAINAANAAFWSKRGG